MKCFACVLEIVVLLVNLDYFIGVDGSATLEILLKTYNNTAATWADGGGCSPCDPRFTLCIDHHLGNSNPDSCLFFKLETDAYWHIDYVVFNSIINGGHPNPIQIPIDNWKEHVLFKIDVWDDSTNVAVTHEWTDRMFVFLSGESGQSMSHVVQGIRANHPTSMEFSHVVYCDTDWYGTRCDKFCAASPLDNYICNSDTGDKICNPGWTDPGSNCTEEINECLSAPCHYGICQDKINSYRCVCYQGTNGTMCDEDVDECVSNPCQNQGACIDQLGGYICDCDINFSGEHCELERPKDSA